MELKGTKQEWGKIYGFLRLLTQQKTAMGNYKFEPRENKDLILKTLSRDIEGGSLYISLVDAGWSFKVDTEYEQKEVTYSINQLQEIEQSLLETIKKSEGDFEHDATENFMFNIGIYDYKSTSETGEDFVGIFSCQNSPEIIKIPLRFHSTLDRHYLIEANRASNFKFDITQIKLSNPESNKINALGDQETGSITRMNEIFRLGGRLKYAGVEGKFFTTSLQLMDMHLARLMGEMVRLFYTGDEITVKGITKELNEINLFKVKEEVISKSRIYEYKIRQLLFAAGCGMKPSRTWRGYSRTDLHIYIDKKGELIAYNPAEKELYERFLFENTRLALPNEAKAKYGEIEKENGQWFIKLNLEICFI